MTNTGAVKLIETVSAKMVALPEAAQREVLNFVEFLLRKTAQNGDNTISVSAARVFKGFEGILSDLQVDITAEELAEARREMWSNFPRAHFYTEQP